MVKIIAGIFCAVSFPLFLNTPASVADELLKKGNGASGALPANALSHAPLSGFINKSVCNDIEPMELTIEEDGKSARSSDKLLLADIRRTPDQWLIVPHRGVKINCGAGTIHADKDSVLLISQGSSYIAVHNLHEHHSHSIYFAIGPLHIPINMASELVIARSSDELKKLLAHCPVARRRLKIEHNSETNCIATSEVKMVDILKKSKFLADFGSSGRPDADRKLKEQLIKSAACVSVVSAFHGPYHRFITGENVEVPAIHPETMQDITTSSQHPSKGGYASAI